MFSCCTVLPDSKETKLGGSNQEVSPPAGENTGLVLVSALLDLFLYCGASICSTMVFPPLRNSDHVVVFMLLCQFPLTFHQTSKWDDPINLIAYEYSCAH